MTNEPFSSGTMELLLESDLKSIQKVVDRTEAFLGTRVSDDDLAYRIVLLATEAVSNAIEHGNKFNAEKKVYFRIEADGEQVEIIVEDEGPGFDPATTKDPRASENLLREGGRGILFMQSMADEVKFEDEGRRVRLIFHAG